MSDKQDDITSDDVEIDLTKISSFFKKAFFATLSFFKANNKYIIPIALILVAMFFSAHYRMYPSHLPITDNWAQSTIYNSIRSDISGQITQQYPNLPDSHRQALIDEEVNKFINENRNVIDPQIQQISAQFRSNFQDDNGDTYLLAIDPYLWYGYAQNYLECGHPGCYIVENESGEEVYTLLRDGRNYISRRMAGESYMGLGIYFFMNIFTETSLMRAMFFIPIIFVALSVLPAFLLGKRLGGNVGGFVSGMIIAVNGALLGRTPGGFADNDGAIVMFPLFIIWCFVGYMEAKTLTKKILFGAGGALSFYLMAFIWATQHVVLAALCAAIMYLGIIGLIELIKHKNFLKAFNSVKGKIFKPFIFIAASIVALSIRNLNYIIGFANSILGFVRWHEVGVREIWPNVITTVAELNIRLYSDLVMALGGNFFVLLAFIGLIIIFLAKDKDEKQHLFLACFIFVWGVATVFSFSRGIRFNILVLPSFAVCVGTAVGVMYKFASKWTVKELNVPLSVVKPIFSFIVVLLFILPITPAGSMLSSARNIALNQIPSYNDAWDETLDLIKADAYPDIGYITTWWDFGHWFVAKGISVTFDGGDQGRRIHWVGNALLTDDEHLSVSIIRMLNCGQENSFNLLEEYLENDTLRAVELTYETIVEDKQTAREILQNENISEEVIDRFLGYTHCDDDILFPQYFITSEDMVGKAGVWGHFGSWNFTRATIWNQVRGRSFEDGIRILTENYSVSQEQAPNMYYEIQRTTADRWVSGWPGYLSDSARCQETGDIMICENGVEVNITSLQAFAHTQEGKVPLKSLSLIDPADGMFKVIEFEGNTAPYSVLLLPNMRTILADPLHAGSMFTRLFFYGGHGLRHFEPFSDKMQVTGQRILTWKIDWQSDEKLEAFTTPDEDIVFEEIELDESDLIEQVETQEPEDMLLE